MPVTTVTNLIIITMDDSRRIIIDGAIAMDGKEIVYVGKAGHAPTGHHRIDGKGRVALPGLIDAHAHADQSLLRGLGDQMHWMPFLDDVIDPYLQGRHPEDAVLANTLSMIEMLKNGTTCFVSPNVDPSDDFDALTDAVNRVGIRAVLGRFTMASENFEHALGVMKRYNGTADGRVSMWFGLDVPRRPGDLDYPAFYKTVKEASLENNYGIVYHFCSEFEDAVYMVNQYGQRPAEWSRDNHGLGENVLLINGCQMTPAEMRILADTGTHLSTSPVANMKMATGILPVPEVLASGINLCLGTDGALNNNGYDMFAEMKAACLLANATERRADALSAETALELATINGAKAINRSDLGSLEVGKQADVVLYDLNRPAAVPLHNVVSNIVFGGNGSHVTDVFIAGSQVVEAGAVTGIDEASVLDSAQARAKLLREQFGYQVQQRWPVE